MDVLGGGDEICTILHLDGPDARNNLLLRNLPATPAVLSWTSHVLLRVFPAHLDNFEFCGGGFLRSGVTPGLFQSRLILVLLLVTG